MLPFFMSFGFNFKRLYFNLVNIPSSTPVTTMTLFGLKPGNIRLGLAQMGTLSPKLKPAPGLRFHKMLGSGRGPAFSLLPDLNRYGLLFTWKTKLMLKMKKPKAKQFNPAFGNALLVTFNYSGISKCVLTAILFQALMVTTAIIT
jgi:hypothetical protein